MSGIMELEQSPFRTHGMRPVKNQEPLFQRDFKSRNDPQTGISNIDVAMLYEDKNKRIRELERFIASLIRVPKNGHDTPESDLSRKAKEILNVH